MNIDQYPIDFPYGATSEPYSPAHPHRGNDYPLVFEPVIIQGTQIGKSGNSGSYKGQTYAPHCHVQAGRDEWAQTTIDSKPYVGKPGTVEKTGNGSEWGNYVAIRVGDVNVFYCHLSRIDVKVGQVIEEENDMIKNEDEADLLYRSIVHEAPSKDWLKSAVGQPWSIVAGKLYQSALWNQQNDAITLYPGMVNAKTALIKEVQALRDSDGKVDKNKVLDYINKHLN